MNQLSGGLIDERLGGTEQGERTVGGIDESGKGGVRRQRSREQSGIHAITNEGVHTSRMISMATYGGGCVQWLGGSRKGKGGEIINSARITPARNGGCRNKT